MNPIQVVLLGVLGVGVGVGLPTVAHGANGGSGSLRLSVDASVGVVSSALQIERRALLDAVKMAVSKVPDADVLTVETATRAHVSLQASIIGKTKTRLRVTAMSPMDGALLAHVTEPVDSRTALSKVPKAVAVVLNSVPWPRPDWVDRSAWVEAQDGGYVLFAVASAQDILDAGLRRMAADNRARAQMARLFNDFSSELMKRYTATVGPPDSVDKEEANICCSSGGGFISGTLAGVEIVDHWKDRPRKGDYARARLVMDDFLRKLGKLKGIPAEQRDAITSIAIDVLDEMSRRGPK